MQRITEASSAGGAGLLYIGLTQVFENWRNPQGWISTLFGVLAIAIPERAKAQ